MVNPARQVSACKSSSTVFRISDDSKETTVESQRLEFNSPVRVEVEIILFLSTILLLFVNLSTELELHPFQYVSSLGAFFPN